MHIGILGGTRNLGRVLLESLASAPAGHQISVFNRGLSLPESKLPAGVRFCQGDRDQPGDVLRWLRSATGAQSSTPDCASPAAFDAIIDLSGMQPAHLAFLRELPAEELSRRVGRYVFVSTSSVYCLPPPVPVAETGPTLAQDSDNEYGTGKLACEELLAEVSADTGLPVRVLRVAGVLGAAPGNPLSQAIERLLEKSPGSASALPAASALKSNANPRLSYLTPASFAELIQQLVRDSEFARGAERFAIWNAADPEPLSAAELWQLAAKSVGRRGTRGPEEAASYFGLAGWPATDLVLATDRLTRAGLGGAASSKTSLAAAAQQCARNLRAHNSLRARVIRFARARVGMILRAARNTRT